MKIFSTKNNKNSGFTLLETLVGLLIFSASILALMSVIGSGVASTQYAKQKIVAGYLAQEGIEYVRNQRDKYMLFNVGGSQAGWDQFKTVIVSETFPITDPDFINFTRQVTATSVDGTNDEMKITSTVSWVQPSGPQTMVFSENLFKWVE
jgi:Tfp pilus assembly protein PilV